MFKRLVLVAVLVVVLLGTVASVSEVRLPGTSPVVTVVGKAPATVTVRVGYYVIIGKPACAPRDLQYQIEGYNPRHETGKPAPKTIRLTATADIPPCNVYDNPTDPLKPTLYRRGYVYQTITLPWKFTRGVYQITVNGIKTTIVVSR